MGFSSRKSGRVEIESARPRPRLHRPLLVTTSPSRPEMKHHENECNVCAETKPADDFPASQLTPGCAHPASTCLECVTASVNTHFGTTPSTQISCPECQQHLGMDQVCRFMTEENYARYVEHWKGSPESNFHGNLCSYAMYTDTNNSSWRTSQRELAKWYGVLSAVARPKYTAVLSDSRSCSVMGVAARSATSTESLGIASTPAKNTTYSYAIPPFAAGSRWRTTPERR